MNIRFRIKAVDDFSRNMKKLNTQLNQVKKSVEDLPEMRSVNLEADTAEFNQAVTDAKANLDGLPEREGVTFTANTGEFNRDVNNAERNVKKFPNTVTTYFRAIGDDFTKRRNKLATSIRNFQEITSGFGMGAILTVLPALSSVVGILAGGIGAITSSFAAAGLGAVGFAAVAVPSIKGVIKANETLAKAQKAVDDAGNEEERAKALKELEKLQDSLTDSQMKTIKALRDFKSFYSDFAKDFRPEVLEIFRKTLDSLKTVLELSKPAIEGSTTAINNLMDALNRNLESEDVKDFFSWLGENAGPHLESTVKALGNFITGIGNMLVAFDPLADSFSDGFLEMSKDFRKWTKTLDKNESFQDFIKYVTENAPTLLSLIGNITTTLVNFGIAMAPVSDFILELADSFFSWTSELFKNHKGMGLLIGVITSLTGLMIVLSPIILILVSVFKTFWPIIKMVFGWIGKLAGFINKFLLPIFTRMYLFFITSILPVLKKLGKFIKDKVAPALKKFWKYIGKALPWIIKIGSKLKWLVGGPFTLIMGIVIELALLIWRNWDSIKDWTLHMAKKIWLALRSAWDKIWRKILIVIAIYKLIKSKFEDIRDAVKEKMGEVWDKITEVWDDVMTFFEDINLYDMGADIIKGLMDGIGGMANSLVRKVEGTVGDAIQGAKNLLGIASPSKVFKQIGEFTGEGMIIGMDRMKSGLMKASERLAQASIPNVGAYSGEDVSSSRHTYENGRTPQPSTYGDAKYDRSNPEPIHITFVNEIDGRELSRATYKYDMENQERHTIKILRARGEF